MILLTQHEFSSAGGDPIHQEFQAIPAVRRKQPLSALSRRLS
jgi:hypothetical protein